MNKKEIATEDGVSKADVKLGSGKKQDKPASADSAKLDASKKQDKPVSADSAKLDASKKQDKPASADSAKLDASKKQDKPVSADSAKLDASKKQDKPASADSAKLDASKKQDKPVSADSAKLDASEEQEKTQLVKKEFSERKMSEDMQNIQSLLGIKIGMTQIFTDNGNCLPVTLVKLGPVEILQKKILEKDGYEALQVGFDELSASKKKKLNKAQQKQMPNYGYRYVREVRASFVDKVKVGEFFNVAAFQVGNFVDVIGISKGRGFTGVMKRHNFRGGPKTHGSHFHRSTGSIGASADPARVFKNRKMPGHHGSSRVTTKGLMIVAIQKEDNLLVVKGAIPGAKGRLVEIRKSSKK